MLQKNREGCCSAIVWREARPGGKEFALEEAKSSYEPTQRDRELHRRDEVVVDWCEVCNLGYLIEFSIRLFDGEL